MVEAPVFFRFFPSLLQYTELPTTSIAFRSLPDSFQPLSASSLPSPVAPRRHRPPPPPTPPPASAARSLHQPLSPSPDAAISRRPATPPASAATHSAAGIRRPEPPSTSLRLRTLPSPVAQRRLQPPPPPPPPPPLLLREYSCYYLLLSLLYSPLSPSLTYCTIILRPSTHLHSY